jgi:hypothetical protein
MRKISRQATAAMERRYTALLAERAVPTGGNRCFFLPGEMSAAAARAVNAAFNPAGSIAGAARQAISARHSAMSSLLVAFIIFPPPLEYKVKCCTELSGRRHLYDLESRDHSTSSHCHALRIPCREV